VEGAEAVPADRAAAELAAQGIQANQFEEWIMSTQVTAKPVAIQDFAAGLRNLPESAFDHTDQVTDFLRSAPVVPDTLAPYLIWNDQHYTRNLIDKTQLYELIAICWEVGQISSVLHPGLFFGAQSIVTRKGKTEIVG
jgi:cysteine dioxygenase type I